MTLIKSSQASNSYLSLLQGARQKKGWPSPKESVPVVAIKTQTIMAVTTPPSNKQAWQMPPEPKTARDRASFKNKVPFSEEIYETLKTGIELLSERVKSKSPLTLEEANWLQNAAEVIIEDANKYGPPERPKRSADNDTEGAES